MRASKMNIFKALTKASVSEEQKLNDTNFGDLELSDELDDADLLAINGGALFSGPLLNGPLLSFGSISIFNESGSFNGGYNEATHTHTNTNNNNNNSNSDLFSNN